MRRPPSRRPRPRPGDRFRAGNRLWSRAEDAILRREYATRSTAALARELRRTRLAVFNRANKLGLSKSLDYQKLQLRRLGKRLATSEAAVRNQFVPGQAPANKGLRRPGWAPGRMGETQFKKGRPAHEARNYRPIGSLRVTSDGALERKVTDDPSLYPARRWVAVARLVWEAERGPIPAGMRVAFRGGFRTTVEAEITIDRLELVSMRELMQRNSVHNLPPALASAVQLLGALKRQIHRRKESLRP